MQNFLNPFSIYSVSHNFIQTVPKHVKVRFEFRAILEIDSMNEKYSADVLIDSEWSEDEEIVNYSAEKNWNPKFYIENSLNINEKIKYSVRKEENKWIINESRYVRGSFWERLELENVILKIKYTQKFSFGTLLLTYIKRVFNHLLIQ